MNESFRKRVTMALVCFAISALHAADSSAKWREGSYMRFSFGASRHDLAGLTTANNQYLSLNNISGGPVDYNDVSPFLFAAELGALVSDRFTVGGRFAWHRESFETAGDLPRLNMNFNVFDLVADMSFAIPSRSGLIVGARAGLSWASVNRWREEFDCAGGFPTLTCTYTEEDKVNWSGGAGVVEVYSGGQFYLSDKFVPFLRAGYAMRDLGTVGELGRGPDPVDLDFSGWFVEIGFGGVIRAR